MTKERRQVKIRKEEFREQARSQMGEELCKFKTERDQESNAAWR